ncbi:MAG: T9SS type A sorting domain-containing protein, partial [Bacteroidota bacterium]
FKTNNIGVGLIEFNKASVVTSKVTYRGTDILESTKSTGITINGLATDVSAEVLKDLKVELYPVPSNGIITLKVGNAPLNEDYSVFVFNTAGQRVLERTFAGNIQENLNLSDQPKGIYSLRIEHKNKVVTKNFSIQ